MRGCTSYKHLVAFDEDNILPVFLLSLNILWTRNGDVLGKIRTHIKICFFFSLTFSFVAELTNILQDQREVLKEHSQVVAALHRGKLTVHIFRYYSILAAQE
jgi:hypothetical protein